MHIRAVILLQVVPLPFEGEMTVSGWNPAVVSNYISQQASLRGIDPNIAIRVAGSEGLNNPVGDAGKSFGPFQLYTGGGLGNAFQKLTGLNPADYLSNWPQQVQYFLNWAVTNGWNPGGIGLGSSYVGGTGGGSHGASAIGIANRQGLSGSHTEPITGGGVTDTSPPVTANPSTETDTTTGAQTGAQVTATTGSNPGQPDIQSLKFSGSIQHAIMQILLVLLGIALLLGGIYLVGSGKA